MLEEEEKYVPRFCYYRILYPITCFFKVHHQVEEGIGDEEMIVTKNTIPALTKSQWATLYICCLCGFLYAYDWELLPLSITEFQKDLNISENDIGIIGGVIRLGNTFSFPLTIAGDIYGRKKMMLISSFAYVVFTCASGFALEAISFTLFQTLSRAFMAAQNTLSTTLIVEGLNNEDRGWGVGAYSAIGILGSALCLVIFGFVGDIPSAWRALYITSVIFFTPLICISKRVPESKRFLDHVEAKNHHHHQEVDDEYHNLLKVRTTKIYRTRLLVCGLVSFFNGFSFAPSETLKIKKLIEVHELSAAAVSFVQIFTGFIAFSSFTLAGSLSDRFGRKRFLMVFNTICGFGVIAFFLSPGNGSPLVFFANFIQLLSGFILSTVKSAYFAELFPTSRRSSSQGLFVVCEYLAGTLSLFLESLLYRYAFGSHWPSSAVLAIPSCLSGILIGFFLPEVNSQDLEHVSPELFGLEEGNEVIEMFEKKILKTEEI